jgi:hypothetical protein
LRCDGVAAGRLTDLQKVFFEQIDDKDGVFFNEWFIRHEEFFLLVFELFLIKRSIPLNDFVTKSNYICILNRKFLGF